MINIFRNKLFDGIEFSEAENVNHCFPPHFHAEYSIGISLNGFQRFEIEGRSYNLKPYSIVVTMPGQVHAHWPLGKVGWSYKSMSIEPDFLKFILRNFSTGNKIPSNSNPVVCHPGLVQMYRQLLLEKESATENKYAGFISSLFAQVKKEPETSIHFLSSEKLDAIKNYLFLHYDHKINLEELSHLFSIDKYQLIRHFKKYTGMTPINYQTSIRIEKARKLIRNHRSIVDAALEVGFYDQSHFHHKFVRYTGSTPGTYYRQCLQKF